MPILQVLSSKPRAGKSTIAAALALGLGRAGAGVMLIRAGESDAARADAEAFSALSFAAAPAEPVAPASAPDGPGIRIVELDAGAQPLDAPAIVVVKGSPGPDDKALATTLGNNLVGTVATMAQPGRVEDLARELTNANLRPMAVLMEDRRLAAPSVEDMRQALAADVLYEGENMRLPIENMLVAPVYTDGAKLHFPRFSGTRAVFTPSYKTDLVLAAIEARSDCVVITGGHQPSHYVLDRAQGEPVTVLLAQHQTPAAVAALADAWGQSSFSGENKAEAAYELLGQHLDWDALLKKLG